MPKNFYSYQSANESLIAKRITLTIILKSKYAFSYFWCRHWRTFTNHWKLHWIILKIFQEYRNDQNKEFNYFPCEHSLKMRFTLGLYAAIIIHSIITNSKQSLWIIVLVSYCYICFYLNAFYTTGNLIVNKGLHRKLWQNLSTMQ